MKAETNTILFLVPEITPRIKYILQYVLEERLGLEVILSTKPLEGLRILEYGAEKSIEESFYMPSYGLLFKQGLYWRLKVEGEGKDVRFPIVENAAGDINFDVLSGIFYLLSRHEEYQSTNWDDFSRFPFKDSIAHRYGFISFPMVDIWVELLRSKLSQRFPDLQLKPNSTAEVAPTIDVDAAFYYNYRPFLNHLISVLGSIIRLQPNAIVDRLTTIFGNNPDPYDTHSQIIDLLKKGDFSDVKSFFLMGNIHSSIDRPGMIKRDAFVSNCLNLWKSVSQIGIHPSFRSNSHPELLEIEKNRLENMVESKVLTSRQHFLILKFPDTYRALIKAEIKEDYTMGFPETIGFRAGTAYSFPWYDLEAEEITSLRIFPVLAMEVTLREYMYCNQQEAKEKINKLWNNMKETGGKFSFIWHNSSWTGCEDWDGWEEVFKHTLNLGIGD